MRVEQRVPGTHRHLRLHRGWRQRDRVFLRHGGVDFNKRFVGCESRLVDGKTIPAKRQPLGHGEAVCGGVELLRNVIGLAHEREMAQDRQAGRVANADAQFAGIALTELRRGNDEGNDRRPHAGSV